MGIGCISVKFDSHILKVIRYVLVVFRHSFSLRCETNLGSRTKCLSALQQRVVNLGKSGCQVNVGCQI